MWSSVLVIRNMIKNNPKILLELSLPVVYMGVHSRHIHELLIICCVSTVGGI